MILTGSADNQSVRTTIEVTRPCKGMMVGMDFSPIERETGSFQQSVSADEIILMVRRIFGDDAKVRSAAELGNGMYNNTYRVELEGDAGSAILRVAPEPGRQFSSERELMRNEYSSTPYFAPIAPLVPRTIGADFTQEIIGRDFLFQSVLPGIPAPQALRLFGRELWPILFRDLGTITRKIHSVRGPAFGHLRGPQFGTWSEAVCSLLGELASDIDGAGLDSADVRQVADLAEKDREALDEVAEPRLLHGDLWTVNVMLAQDTAEPRIVGVFDNDRTLWGDPAADWTIHMAGKKPGTERDAFWETYGSAAVTSGAARRALFYQARHIAAIRLERCRLAGDVAETHEQMREVIDRLHA